MVKNKGPQKKDKPTNYLDESLLRVQADTPDIRDFPYQPALIPLKTEIPAPKNLNILDQGQEGACTGFGLAAVINLLLSQRDEPRQVSARMLYEMAKKFDEWRGENYSGSSCRGAIRGWHNTGVCSEDLAPYNASEENWQLNIKQAIDARETTVGAYYRINKRISDFHAALNEVNAIYVSGNVHDGWQPANITDEGTIPYLDENTSRGGHAFAIVGYNDRGFWVQNSWGDDWGKNGIALWTYKDWLENIKDAWVVRLAIPTPQIWHLTPNTSPHGHKEEWLFQKSPTRDEILGHFVHIDDGNFDEKGKYWMDLTSIMDTANHVAKSPDYDHLLLYAHGGLNSIKASARRIAAMKKVFKKNRIYPFHFMYDTGLLEEIKDVVLGKKVDIENRVGGFTDFTDELIENSTRQIGRALWREMKGGAQKPFEPQKAGTETIQSFLNALDRDSAQEKEIHIVGHSTGAILLAALLQAMQGSANALRIDSCSLLAPACTLQIFRDVYQPLLEIRGSNSFGIEKMIIYNLTDKLERDDTVTPLYRKSLLYLVSNAFEEKRGEHLLGMEKFYHYLKNLPGPRILRHELSEGRTKDRTSSETHGGFDNDPNTMNDILKTILKNSFNKDKAFTEENLDY